MEHEVVLKIKDGWCHIYVDDIRKTSLEVKDRNFAISEARQYARKLNLSEYTLVENGYSERIKF